MQEPNYFLKWKYISKDTYVVQDKNISRNVAISQIIGKHILRTPWQCLNWKQGDFRISVDTVPELCESMWWVRICSAGFVSLKLCKKWVCICSVGFAGFVGLNLWKIGFHLLPAHWSLYPDTHSAPMMTRYISLYQIPQIFQICQFTQMYPSICDDFSPFGDLTFEITIIECQVEFIYNKNVKEKRLLVLGSQEIFL